MQTVKDRIDTKMSNLEWDIYGKFFVLMKCEAKSKLNANGTFTADDIRGFNLHTKFYDPQHQVGAMILRWKEAGLIEGTGKFPCSKVPANHGHRIAEYRLTSWDEE
jgi:hypothetical protein